MMCSLGRHQLEHDIPAPRNRARAPRPHCSRKELRDARLKIKRALEDEVHALPDGQAKAQEQFALEFEAMPPGVALIEELPVSEVKLPYWVDAP